MDRCSNRSCSAFCRPRSNSCSFLAVLLVKYSPVYAIIIALTIFAYAIFTILTTEWRTKYRRLMNEEQRA